MQKLVEMAVRYGRKLKSSQTGYLHFYYGDDTPCHHTIPVVENILYALALCRTCLVENVQEGKAILEGILHFQVTEEGMAQGNFPIYLHEFPICKDRFTGVRAACGLFWILKQFHSVLGRELLQKTEKALTLALRHALKTHVEKPAPYTLALQIGCAATAAAELLQDPLLKNDLLPSTFSFHPSCYSSESLGEMLTSLAMVYPQLVGTPWEPLWHYVEATWDPQTGCYVGPAVKEWQDGYEPQTTLYDLFLGSLTDTFPARCLKESPIHLRGALIPSSLEGRSQKAEGRSLLALAETSAGVPASVARRFVWGDRSRVHSMVLHGGSATSFYEGAHGVVSASASKLPPSFECRLEGEFDPEDRDAHAEISFYFDVHDSFEFLVEGEQASTFRLDEKLTIRSGGRTFNISFHLDAGEGRFLGHRVLGNRPLQRDKKGTAYDWHIFLRTIERSPSCRLTIALEMA